MFYMNAPQLYPLCLNFLQKEVMIGIKETQAHQKDKATVKTNSLCCANHLLHFLHSDVLRSQMALLGLPSWDQAVPRERQTKCTSFFTVAMINTTTSSNMGRKGFLWFVGYSLSTREAKAGI